MKERKGVDSNCNLKVKNAFINKKLYIYIYLIQLRACLSS